MEDDFIAKRVTQLRLKKGVSARSMSLSIGQNPVYINNIESGKALPSLSGLFYICDYFKITPLDFFDADNQNPEKLNQIIGALKKLDDDQLNIVMEVIKGLSKNTP